MKKALLGLMLGMFSVLPMQTTGCATHTHTTVAEPGVRTEVHTVEVDDDDDDGGVISGIFEILGDIISLPFRAIGALFDALF